MKKFAFACIFGLLVLAMSAQTPVLLRSAQYLDFKGVSLQISNSSTLVFWNDTRSTSTNIYAQKIASDGTILWPQARPVTIGTMEKRISSAILTSDGNVIVAYHEFTPDFYTQNLKIQKMSLAGQCLWQSDGVTVTSTTNYGLQCTLVPNSVGGAYTAHMVTNGISVKNFNANGLNQWPETIVSQTAPMYNLEALTDGVGGIILNVNTYNTGSSFGNFTLRLNSEADVVGSNPFISSTSQVPLRFRMIRNTLGDYFLYSIVNNAIQYQKIDVNANLLLPEIVSQSLDGSASYISNFCFEPATDGGLYVAILGYPTYETPVIYLDRLDTNAQQVWDNQLAYTAENEVSRLDLAVNQNNEAWLCWLESTYMGNFPQTWIKTVKALPDGNTAFAGTIVGNDTAYKLNPAVLAFNSNATLVWNEMFNERNSLKCQVITNSGSSVLEPEGRSFHWVLNGCAELCSSQSIGNHFIYVYNDYRKAFSNSIYYQITDNNLNTLLEVNGRALNPESENEEVYLDCISLPNYRVAILYSVYFGGSYSLYLQEITASGSKIHPGYGLLINNDAQPLNYSGAKLGYVDGDLLIVWRGYQGSDASIGIWGQRLHNSLPMWETTGKVLVTGANNSISINAIKGNYLVFTWDNYVLNQSGIRALLMDNNGNPVAGWAENGLPISETAENYYQIFSSAGLNADDLIICYTEVTYLGFATYAQKISSIGTKPWGMNGALLEEDDQWSFFSVEDAIYGDPIECLIKPDNQNFVAFQKINQNGELQYAMPGTMIDYAWNTIQQTKMIKYANGGYSIVFTGWEDQLARINHRYLNPDGTISETEPLSIATNPSGFWSIQTTQRDNIGIITYTDGNSYVISRGDAIPLTNLWACRINAPAVSGEDSVQKPVVFSSSNYPNPFNPSTTIRFSQVDANPVKVEIYNAKGQLVKVLLNETKAAGEHEIVWNGTDNQGRNVASGVYLYKIHAGKFSHTKKMMLMK